MKDIIVKIPMQVIPKLPTNAFGCKCGRQIYVQFEAGYDCHVKKLTCACGKVVVKDCFLYMTPTRTIRLLSFWGRVKWLFAGRE